jgi:hypothetical protein
MDQTRASELGELVQGIDAVAKRKSLGIRLVLFSCEISSTDINVALASLFTDVPWVDTATAKEPGEDPLNYFGVLKPTLKRRAPQPNELYPLRKVSNTGFVESMGNIFIGLLLGTVLTDLAILPGTSSVLDKTP